MAGECSDLSSFCVAALVSIVDIIIIMAGTISWNIGAEEPANKHVRAGQDKLLCHIERPTRLKRGVLQQLI